MARGRAFFLMTLCLPSGGASPAGAADTPIATLARQGPMLPEFLLHNRYFGQRSEHYFEHFSAMINAWVQRRTAGGTPEQALTDMFRVRGALARKMGDLDFLHYQTFRRYSSPKVWSGLGQLNNILYEEEPWAELLAIFSRRVQAAGGLYEVKSTLGGVTTDIGVVGLAGYPPFARIANPNWPADMIGIVHAQVDGRRLAQQALARLAAAQGPEGMAQAARQWVAMPTLRGSRSYFSAAATGEIFLKERRILLLGDPWDYLMLFTKEDSEAVPIFASHLRRGGITLAERGQHITYLNMHEEITGLSRQHRAP